MIERIMKKFALSREGAQGFVRAVIACVAEGVALMVPVTLLYYLVGDLMNGAVPTAHVFLYGFGIAAALALIALASLWKYNATYFTTYRESGVKRINDLTFFPSPVIIPTDGKRRSAGRGKPRRPTFISMRVAARFFFRV